MLRLPSPACAPGRDEVGGTLDVPWLWYWSPPVSFKVPACGCAVSRLLRLAGVLFSEGRGVLGGRQVWGGCGTTARVQAHRAPRAPVWALAARLGERRWRGGLRQGLRRRVSRAWIGGRLLEYLRGAESCEVVGLARGLAWGLGPGRKGGAARVDGFGDRLGGC